MNSYDCVFSFNLFKPQSNILMESTVAADTVPSGPLRLRGRLPTDRITAVFDASISLQLATNNMASSKDFSEYLWCFS